MYKGGEFVLRELRLQKGLTQSELAEKLGISTSMVQKIELGQRFPGLKIALKFADFYRKPLRRLFFDQNTHDGDSL